jgi:hypothetical protein
MGKTNKEIEKQSNRDANRDPITGTPGAHPVGVGVGAAAGGAAAGAAVGTVAGPVGTLVGAAVGAVVGGLAGKGVAEKIDPTVEDAYWRKNYMTEPYYQTGRGYEDYVHAYRTGYEGRARHQARTFEEAERDLQADYDKRRAGKGLTWEHGKLPARAAWDRIDRTSSADSQGSR